ncbi:MAG: alpha/beta hydrolase [Pseudomonadales bacterium]|nr:alpha/beta hydrolase [Pseudomonadales bacterium]
MLTLQKIKELNLPMPTAALCLSPLTDMASEGDSMVSNAKHDPMFHHRAMRYVTRFHARHHDDPRHPEISPVHSNFEGFPPLLLQVGSTEILLNDSERVAVSAIEAGVPVELAVWHQMPHVFSLFGGIVPESIHGIREIAEFIGKHLFGRPGAH